MNEPEDRPTPSDRPAPYGDPPPQLGDQPVGDQPLGDQPLGDQPSGDSPFAEQPGPAPEPAARWEDVVDPEPVAVADPAADPDPVAQEWPEPARPAPAPAAPVAPVAPADDDELEDDYDDYDPRMSRWVSLLATLGTALIGIVTVQVLASIVEGLTLKSGQRVGVPDDLLHRLGYPFGGLGATALVFLVLGVVLVSMPSVLDELLSESQDRVVGIALLVATVMGVIIAIGSLLAVRANLHEYAAKNVPVPSYVRVQFTNFLLGSLGAAALALFGAVAAMNERKRESV
jgi:hypothetical protein